MWDACSMAADMEAKGMNYAAMFNVPGNFHTCYRWFKDCRDMGMDNPALPVSWEVFYNATDMWFNLSAGSPRWFLEAYRLGGADVLELASRMDEDSRVIQAYLDMFFNIGDDRKAHPWMVRYIWEPGRTREGRLFFYDYVLKAAAYSVGPAMVDIITSPGMVDGEDAEDKLLKMIQRERRHSALTVASAGTRVPKELSIPLDDRVLAAWQEARDAATAGGGDLGLRKLVEAVTSQLTMTHPGNAPKESREDVVL